MPKYNVGLAKLEIGDYNATTGAATNFVELQVYKDTCTITEAKATKTPYFQAGKPAPVKIGLQTQPVVVMFSVMNTEASSLLQLFGGTVTTLNGVSTWNKPKGNQAEVIKILKATTLDGSVITVARGSLLAGKTFNLAENNIALIEVEVTETETGLPAVFNFTVSDPATV